VRRGHFPPNECLQKALLSEMANFFSLLTEIFGIKLSRASAEEENLFDHPTAAELHEEERRQQVKCSVAKAQQIFPSTCLI